MPRAIDIARYLIRLASPTESEDADCLCTMRLQKLLYYAQGWHLGATGQPLFGETIEAWKHGPVVRVVYPVFKGYPLAIPPAEGREDDALTDQTKEFLRAIWKQYGGFSGTALRNMTHRERPWIDARGDLPEDAHSDEEITQHSMRDYFLPRYVAQLKKSDPRVSLAAWKTSAEAVASGQASTAGDIRRELRDRRSRSTAG